MIHKSSFTRGNLSEGQDLIGIATFWLKIWKITCISVIDYWGTIPVEILVSDKVWKLNCADAGNLSNLEQRVWLLLNFFSFQRNLIAFLMQKTFLMCLTYTLYWLHILYWVLCLWQIHICLLWHGNFCSFPLVPPRTLSHPVIQQVSLHAELLFREMARTSEKSKWYAPTKLGGTNGKIQNFKLVTWIKKRYLFCFGPHLGLSHYSSPHEIIAPLMVYLPWLEGL